MLEQEKKEILEDNYLLNKRKDARMKNKFTKAKNVYFFIGIVLGLLIIGTVYFLTSYSNVYHIAVEGNIYLKDEEIISLSGISTDSKYLLVSPNKAKKNILNNNLISECKVEKLDSRLIKITVSEHKVIGYIYELSEAKLLLDNDERVLLDVDNMHIINMVPLIEGFTSEQISSIIKGFEDLDYKAINEISEIHNYAVSYDPNMLEVIMRDGNTVFLSSSGLKLLNNYYSIISSIDRSSSKACIYLDELTNSGYISKCPWEKDTVVEEEKEEETEE